MKSSIKDPIEKTVEDALNFAKVEYTSPSHNGLDFYLPEHDVHIECKQFYTQRSSEQLTRAANVILIQGTKAALAFAKMITP